MKHTSSSLRAALSAAGLLTATLVVAFAIPSAKADPLIPVSLPNGIAAGDVDATSAVLWTRTITPGAVTFEVSPSLFFAPLSFSAQVQANDPLLPVKTQATGLRAGQRYFYRVSDESGGQLIGTFRTAMNGPSPGRSLRFGVSGDWRGELAPFPAISNVPRRFLDFFVRLGDTIYADFPSPDLPIAQAQTIEEYRIKHGENYGSRLGLNSWGRIQATTPIFSTIDDHEVTNDFAGGAPASTDERFPEMMGLINQTQLYQNGLRAFTEYNPQQFGQYTNTGDERFDGRPDLYRHQRYGDLAATFILDARSFRDTELPGVNNLLDSDEVGAFLATSFDVNPATGEPLPRRTMLGRPQLDRLKNDLQAAQADGIAWKFVMVPEPVQNLGVLAAADRFEGYASERTELLSFIDQENIQNVVFIAADIHGTVINDLNYQLPQELLAALAQGDPALAPQYPSGAFEVVTGAVAFDAPFGPTVVDLIDGVAVDAEGNTLQDVFLQGVGVADVETFNRLPNSARNLALTSLVDQQIVPLGYDPVGLEDDDNSGIDARLLRGQYTAVFTYGWTEFYIAPFSRRLWVTTFGIEPYTAAQVGPEILLRKPRVVSQFVVEMQR
ncbi:MAG: alkaline phosphatase D family protein [Xanthomonadales bacterium]|nr:alkaline phosphatase D family protein [Xanthomonadales bacterium]